MENELYHHGIKGMKWGVRRTPEQLGYKKAQKKAKKALAAQNALQKYKVKKIQRIEKMYGKNIAKIEDGLDYDPDNKDLKRELKRLMMLRDQDRKAVENMSYTDVVNEKAAIRKARMDKAVFVAETVGSGIMNTTLWAARMGLIGIKAYGLFKGVQVLGELGNNAIEWLQSPEGQEFVTKGYNTVNTFITAGDTIVKLTNKDLGSYIDSKDLADKITTEAINYGKQEFDRQMKNINM